MKLFLSLLILSTSVTSCYNYKVFPKEYRTTNHNEPKKIAFVVNPELKEEYEILKQSAIFEFTTDSENNKAVKLRLQPLVKGFVCGNAIVISTFSLGQVPVYFPGIYRYRFQEIRMGDTTSRDFALQVAQRIWFWDIFAVNKNFKGKAGNALLGNYYKE